MTRRMPSSKFFGALASGSLTDLRPVSGKTFRFPSAAAVVEARRWDENDAALGSGYNKDWYVLTPTGNDRFYVNGPYGPGEPDHWSAHDRG